MRLNTDTLQRGGQMTHRGLAFAGLTIVLGLGASTAAVTQGIDATPIRPTPLEVKPPADRPSNVPGRATVLVPKSGPNRGTARAPGLRVTFRQGGQPAFRAPAARHFVICLAVVDASPHVPPCTWPGQFNAPAASLPNTAYVDPQLGSQPHIREYEFALPLSQTAAYLDRPLAVTVGACAATSTSSCAFSVPVRFVWSTRNLTTPDFVNLRRITDGQTGGLTVDVVASNDGESEIGPFKVKVEFYESHVDASGRCQTDVNDSRVGEGDFAIDARGYIHRIDSLGPPGQRRQPADVIGIALDRSVIGIRTTEVQVPFMPAAATSRTIASAVGFSFSWANTSSPKRFIGLTALDSGSVIDESDESDNARVECLRAVSR